MPSRRHASEPTPGSLADVQAEADPHSVARSIVLRRLTASARTTRELHDDLAKRGIDETVIEDVLGRFTELGLIDDQAYAQMWVSSRSRTRGTARSVLRQELRRKGVDDMAIQTAIDEVDDEAERARGAALIRAKLPSTVRLDDQARYRRLLGVLQRRGYSGGVAHGILREVLGELSADLDVVQIAE